MDKDRYERQIAWLEEKLSNAHEENGRLHAKVKELQKDKERARLQSMQGISAFMSKLYADLGNIQAELLKHIASVNKELNQEHTARANDLLREIQSMFAIEDKRSAAELD